MSKYYEEGFKKTAEAYGVNPQILVKSAQSSYINK